MAQLHKAEFDQLRDLLGMSEPSGGPERRGPTEGAPQWVGALSRVAPWKLAVTGALLLAAVVLAAVLMGTFDRPSIVVRGTDGGEPRTTASEEPAQVDNGKVAEEGSRPDAAPLPALCVHVAGAVQAPGVYTLAADARVNDAVAAAGGFAPDAEPDALNLASPLVDGAKVLVPRVGEEVTDASMGSGSFEASPGVVNINVAGVDELQALPGIGPSLAASIVEDRGANGPFSCPEDLMRVSGIGEKKFSRLAGMVVV